MKKLLFTGFMIPLLVSCSNESGKPSIDIMKDCLSTELGSSVKILGYEHQDGINKEIDGVKYYDAYFNAEVKFLSNVGNRFDVGDEYKMVKVAVKLLKSEKGWNCQEYDWSNAKLIKINKGASEDDKVNGEVFQKALKQPNIHTTSDNGVYKQEYIPNNNLMYPEVSQRKLSRTELAGRSNWELKIMRNEIYAKYGYIFQSQDLHNYFSEKNWYKPRYKDVSNRLTPLERENAATIKSME